VVKIFSDEKEWSFRAETYETSTNSQNLDIEESVSLRYLA